MLATANPHKRREFARLLAPLAVDALPPGVELPPETGTTFAANALVKARAAAQATGRPAIADDSGIEAQALGGAPGVRSARYAGEHATDEENLAKLRAEAPAGSGAALRLRARLRGPRAATSSSSSKGECSGRMAPSRAASGGFGYDPVVRARRRADGRTMAELSDEEKDAISHRGRAPPGRCAHG